MAPLPAIMANETGVSASVTKYIAPLVVEEQDGRPETATIGRDGEPQLAPLSPL